MFRCENAYLPSLSQCNPYQLMIHRRQNYCLLWRQLQVCTCVCSVWSQLFSTQPIHKIANRNLLSHKFSGSWLSGAINTKKRRFLATRSTTNSAVNVTHPVVSAGAATIWTDTLMHRDDSQLFQKCLTSARSDD